MTPLEQIKEICDGIKYSRDVPDMAKLIARENDIIIIVGGSDDLMYCYGARCYMTQEQEHGYAENGDTLEDIPDKQLEFEANQLGLMIHWCGAIGGMPYVDDYDEDRDGAFTYSVKDGIEFLDFKIMDDGEVYCTGKIIQLPDGFLSSLDATRPILVGDGGVGGVALPSVHCEVAQYFLSQDQSSHWYVVPISRKDEWNDWVDLDEDDEAGWEVPEYAISAGNPSSVIFTGFEIN